MDVNKVQKIIISYLETGTIESVTDSRNLAVAIKEAYDAGLLREKDDGQLKIEFLG